MIVIRKEANGLEAAFSNEEWRAIKEALCERELNLTRIRREHSLIQAMLHDIMNQEHELNKQKEQIND